MKIQNWYIKNVKFKPDERKAVAYYISKKILSGWELTEGEVDAKLAFGEKEGNGKTERIQLQKLVEFKKKTK